jgi:SSS family solute:Na+ symporter
MGNLGTLDWIVLGGYFAILLGVAAWVIMQRKKNTEDYFLAGRNIGWFVVGASIFASNIGSEHVVGLAGQGFENGMPMAHYELHAWIVLLLGWVFLPFYARSGVFTMPEFLERRYGTRARWFLSIFSLVGYVMTKVSVTIFAGGMVIAALFQVDFWEGALLTVVITGIYTVLGGMRAVVYTEAFQTVILILGATLTLYLGLQEVGGWSELKATVGSEHFNMWRPMSDPDFPWTGLVFGGAIVGIWYWCTDQYIVQRTLAAKNITIGRRGAIFGAFLKLLPVFIFMVPGIIAYAMVLQGKMTLEDADQALPALMVKLLPDGIRGLVAGGLLAALMSSLASVFNSCSTLFTIDVYQKVRPERSEAHYFRVGQIATVIVVILGIIWIPVMERISGTLYQYLQSVQSYIAPPITAVFLLGIFSKRITEKAAMATLWSGVVIGAARLILELSKESLTPGSLVYQFADINFMHFAIIMFVICVAILIGVSLVTPQQSEAQLEGLTFATITDEQKASEKNNYGLIDVVVSVFLVAAIVCILVYFTG